MRFQRTPQIGTARRDHRLASSPDHAVRSPWPRARSCPSSSTPGRRTCTPAGHTRRLVPGGGTRGSSHRHTAGPPRHKEALRSNRTAEERKTRSLRVTRGAPEMPARGGTLSGVRQGMSHASTPTPPRPLLFHQSSEVENHRAWFLARNPHTPPLRRDGSCCKKSASRQQGRIPGVTSRLAPPLLYTRGTRRV